MRGRCEGACVMCTDLSVGGQSQWWEALCKGRTTCDSLEDEMGGNVIVVVCVFGVVGRCNVFSLFSGK